MRRSHGLAPAGLVVAALLGLPGSGSAAPPRAFTATPACTRAALQGGLGRGPARAPRAIIIWPFGCERGWAYAAVDDRRYTFTALFRADAGRWATVSRARPCARGELPRRIRHAACGSN